MLNRDDYDTETIECLYFKNFKSFIESKIFFFVLNGEVGCNKKTKSILSNLFSYHGKACLTVS